MRLRSVLLVCALHAGPAAHAEEFHCRTERGASPYALGPSRDHDHLRFAPRQRDRTRAFHAFAASFDGTDDDDGDGAGDLRANPEWVAYHLRGVAPNDDGTFSEPDVSIRRPSPWYRSDDLAFVWQAAGARDGLDRSYAGIGRVFNRGHFMMADHAQRISAEASCNTHVFWNASPQAAAFNQGPWLHLETYTAALSNMAGDAWIMTGPIFDAGEPILTIGDRGEAPVAIPHAFWKLIVIQLPSGRIDWRALVYEHPTISIRRGPRPDPSWISGIETCRSADAAFDHSAALVSLADLETRTGLRFFPERAEYALLAHRRPANLWDVPEHFWSGYRCGPAH